MVLGSFSLEIVSDMSANLQILSPLLKIDIYTLDISSETSVTELIFILVLSKHWQVTNTIEKSRIHVKQPITIYLQFKF
jgi:hypothetical protein